MTTRRAAAAVCRYEPLDAFTVRAPLLPVEAYRALGEHGIAFVPGSLVPRDPLVARALAVGSADLLGALEKSSPQGADAPRLLRKLRRFLIRMATRPTPFGLFAGVALGTWGTHTDLRAAPTPWFTRTRPDMEWLVAFVARLEARPEVRAELRFAANPAALVRGDRVLLAEPARLTGNDAAGPVSVRATAAVQRALSRAREPVAYADLAADLLAHVPGATPEKVERVLTELWQLTLLIGDLRPPLTAAAPALYVLERLDAIPAAAGAAAQLRAVLDGAAAWDALPAEAGAAAYRSLTERANAIVRTETGTALQVDMGLRLAGTRLARGVGEEVARAAELLLRLSPAPDGLAYLSGYRRAFLARYGHDREVPLLELLDPDAGLGPPFGYGNGTALDPARAAARASTLLALAHGALHDHARAIELDEATVARLQTWSPDAASAPSSLDVNAFVAAPSAAAIDAGDFQVVIGPNLGAQSAGRNLARFGDLLGPPARSALERAAAAEDDGDGIWAELVYLPHAPRAANVAVRPAVRGYEIPFGVAPGVPRDRAIPLDELSVTVREGRFRVRWRGRDVVPCTGHMLNSLRAPLPYRFLADVSRDGVCQLTAFDWGPAANLPYLPRVASGRIVLRPAEWRIDPALRAAELSARAPDRFADVLRRWRAHWSVPRHVYLAAGDNRLLLDLEDDEHADDLRGELDRLRDGAQLVLQEALPGLNDVWMPGPQGRFAAELVVSLALTRKSERASRPGPGTAAKPASAAAAKPLPVPVPAHVRLRLPGSDWSFAKLYLPREAEDGVLAGPLRAFAQTMRDRGVAREWFFLRYADPDAHLRVRFHGEPETLLRELVPAFSAWAAELVADGRCTRVVFDTYEREVERYGGDEGCALAETLFCADSQAVAELLQIARTAQIPFDRTMLAVLGVDALLEGLGLGSAERLAWYAGQDTARHEVSAEYRARKAELRRFASDPAQLAAAACGSEIVRCFATRRAALARVADGLAALQEHGRLTQRPAELYRSYVHMHCNRLFAGDPAAEARTIGLLARTWDGLERTAAAERKRSGAPAS